MSGSVSVYLRGNEVFVIPQGGGGGLYFDVEPVLVVSPSATEVSKAILEALAISTSAPHTPPADLKKRKSPVLARAKVRSLKDFYAGAAHAFLYRDGGALQVLPFRPAADGRGFEVSDDPIALSEGDGLGERALAILSSLTRAPAK